MPGSKPAHTPCAHRWARETGQAPCYAMERTVFPVRVHSPVRFIPVLHIGRARVGIESGKLGQAWCSRAPVRLHGPVYPVPPPRTSTPVAAPCTRLSLRLIPTELLRPALPELPPLSPEAPEPLSPEAPEPLSPSPESPACPAPPESSFTISRPFGTHF